MGLAPMVSAECDTFISFNTTYTHFSIIHFTPPIVAAKGPGQGPSTPSVLELEGNGFLLRFSEHASSVLLLVWVLSFL